MSTQMLLKFSVFGLECTALAMRALRRAVKKLNFRRSYFTPDLVSYHFYFPLVTWTLALYNVGAIPG